MQSYSIIIMYGIMSLMGWYGCVFTTKKVIKEIGFHEKYYPQKYVLPDRKMRKMFGIEKKEIPKWCYREFLMSFVYLAMFLNSTLAYLLFANKLIVAQVFVWGYCIVMGVHMLHFIIFMILYS